MDEDALDDIIDDLRPRIEEEARKLIKSDPEKYFDELAEAAGVPKPSERSDDAPEAAKELRESVGDRDDIDTDLLDDFLDRPYLLNPEGDGYELIVPVFVHNFQVGEYRGKTEDGMFNVFYLDKTTRMLHDVPECVRSDPRIDGLNFEDRFKVEGNFIYYDEGDRAFLEDTADVNEHLAEIRDDHARIKDGHEYALLEALLTHGFDPFQPDPIDDADLRDPDVGFDLRDYQKEWVAQVMEEGHGCFVGPTGSGKSIPTLYLFASLKGPKALVCHGRMTVGQWLAYFEKWTDIKAADLTDVDPAEAAAGDYEVFVVTYHSLDKLHAIIQSDDIDIEEFAALATDESHALPANTFAGAATIPAKYRWGMTATPFREDDREEAIQAFTGPYVGLDWDDILDQQGKERHEVNVHIVEEQADKLDEAAALFEEVEGQRTLIFSDGIDFGKELADRLGLEFVHGDTNDQYDTILDAVDRDGAAVVSRVGDHGISVPELEVVIECDFLFGSKRQQLQRTGRLLHGYDGDRHDILFDEAEWDKHHKRVFSLLDRGFELNLPDGVEIPDDYGADDGRNLDIDTSGAGLDDDTLDVIKSAHDRADRKKDMSPAEVLQHDAVQQEIEKRLGNVDRSTKKGKKAIAAVLHADEPLTNDDLAYKVDYNTSSMRKITKTLADGPEKTAILKEADDVGGRAKHFELNTSRLKDWILNKEAQEEEREKVEDTAAELFGVEE